jgi:hypothetical protein
MTWSVKTGSLLIAQIHGYLLGLKSIKTLTVGLQVLLILCKNFRPDLAKTTQLLEKKSKCEF